MPALAAIPWLVPLITGVSAAATLGEGIYSATQGGGSPTATSTQTDAQQAAQQKLAQQKAAYLTSMAGGAAPPTGTSGLTGPSMSGSGGPSPDDLKAMMALLQPGGSGGGNLSGGFNPQVVTPGASNGLTSLSV